LGQYPRNTEIRNTRQFAILSDEELAMIAGDMGLAVLDPALLGATMVLEGIPDFTHLPPSSRLQGTSGATLVVDLENRPCTLPAKPIDARHAGFGKAFKPAAKDRRGVTAWVEREGTFTLGDAVTLHIPDQRAWRGLQG
jgi:MOSC domain-containing protein YiiM